jgi:hypothetical protein
MSHPVPVERLREASDTSLEQPAGPLSVIPALAWTGIVLGTGETPVLRGLSAGQAFPPTLKV